MNKRKYGDGEASNTASEASSAGRDNLPSGSPNASSSTLLDDEGIRVLLVQHESAFFWAGDGSNGSSPTSPSNDPPPADHQCPRCGRGYRRRDSLARHLRLECGHEPKFGCPYCPHRAKLKENLVRHVRARHPTAWERS